ncbi:ATP-binding protein [Aliiroseovarius crassostreae]|uniref:ATP-binding protein n=1 Tax=Aliiroseovarius crassostreae TaxID=154981 RepID=UPI003C7A6D30
MLNLKTLIENHEEWLTDRVVHYAQQKSYTQYSSTLREAWRISICGLSEPLVQFIEAAQSSDVPHKAAVQDATEFGVAQGLRHRALGIDLGNFVGLLKLYRNAYLDLIHAKEPDSNQSGLLRDLIMELFDSIEVGLLDAWGTTNVSDQLVELQTRNRELSNEKNKYLTVFESIAEPAILLDPEGAPTHVNAAANRLLLGEEQPGAGYYGDLTNPLLHMIVGKLLRSSKASTGPVTLDTPHGERSFDVSTQNMLDISKKFAGSVIILQDITDYLKAIEAAQAADRAKSMFLNTISHEIRTPLNSILGLTGLMEDGEFPPKETRQLRSIRASGEMLSALIENVLGLSKAEADALQRVEQDFHLEDMCDAIFQVLELEEDRKRPKLIRHIAPDVPLHLHGDGHKLRHVLLNLLSNALKFTDEGTVTLSVSSQGALDANRHPLRFEVIDTGPGVADDAIDTLFEPFLQGEHSGAVTPGGSGLGLAICKHLVDFLGGEISYRPNPAGGSIFTVVMDFSPAKQHKQPGQSASCHRVLVVEDDPVNAIVIEGYLKELGNDVTLVRSFPDAELALSQPDFDLVITDYRLGQHTGLDVARAVRETELKTDRSIPIVIVTAAIPHDSNNQIQKLGIDLFLEKPFSRYELANALSCVGPGNTVDPHADRNSTYQPVSRDALNRLLSDLGFTRCQTVVQSFQSNLPSMMSGMQSRLDLDDVDGISELTHQLISAAGFIGAGRLVSLAKQLRKNCKNRERAPMSEALDDLCCEGKRVLMALEREWREISAAYLGP